jgi:glucuronokinase
MRPAPRHALVPARVGLVGNPSDGYGGAVLAAIVDAWAAEAVATPTTGGVRLSSRTAGVAEWASVNALIADVAARRTDAPHGIVAAALAALDDHLNGGVPGVEVEWSSTVPRSVGLAGSSAVAIAVIEAVSALAGGPADPQVVAALALDAEVHWMGIAAGWQDRIVQAHRGAVLVDAGDMSTSIEGRAVPAVLRLPGFAVDAVIGWRPDDRETSAVYHQALRGRAADGALADGMLRLGDLARRAATTVAGGDAAGLRELVDASWRTRCDSAPLHPRHAQLVEAVRSTGVIATSPGSGGSVVALPAGRDAGATAIAALRAVGARSVSVTLR